MYIQVRLFIHQKMYLENNRKITAKQHLKENSNKREKYEYQNFESICIASRIP